MTKRETQAITTRYWRPGENYTQEIIEGVKGKIEDKDFVVISEKAISTATGNIVDEASAKPSLSARLIARLWMRIVWGYFLGLLCRFQAVTLQRLRDYPVETGSSHKQTVLQHATLLQALMFGSEGGIDGSNLPYSYVSLPLRNADKIARSIQRQLWLSLGRKAFVMIADTDKTYSLGNFHFTPHPKPAKGIISSGGVCAYVAGRMCRLRRRATPLAVAGCKIRAEQALNIAEAANRSRGYGAGRTVWDMAKKFNVDLTHVSWEMLEAVRHKPIVIVRRKR